MRSRWMTLAMAPVVALGLSCSDSTGPDPELERLVLAFCPTELPMWFAYQNEGEPWRRVQANASNAFEFDASPRVGIAFTFDFGTSWFTDIYYTTADEIRPLSGIACTETQGTKTVTGSVANVPAGSRARLTLSGASDIVTGPSTSYALSGVASNPRDLLGIRQTVGVSATMPNRVVLRRAIDPLNNAVLPVMDFGTEGQAIATHTASIVGLFSGEDNYLDIEFSTATGTSDTLYSSPLFTASSQTLYGVPSGLTQTGDLHRIQLNADASSGYRSLIHWTRLPGDKAFTLGAALLQPSATNVAESPYPRMRISLPAQSDYPSFATAFFMQPGRTIFVTLTADHVNGPITSWGNEIPDLTPAGGFPMDAALRNNTGTDVFVEAYHGEVAAFIGGTAVDGATVRYAGRGIATSTRQMNVIGERQAMRPPSFRRAFSK